MGKRKRGDVERPEQVNGNHKKVSESANKVVQASTISNAPEEAGSINSKPQQQTPTTVQIITGSYERVLHGFQGAVVDASATTESTSVQFVDTFLFNAHASAIRCLALSPLPSEDTLAENVRVILASGATDERINLYSLSASPLTENDKLPSIPTLAGNKILENPDNRELGALLQHSSSITSLYFPTRSKLLAAAEDNTISVSRTKDFEVVSTIKAPRPKVQGRPSGDTAPPGASPAGINDFAVHPSMKLMVSVGKGEKCMRLWNLVTGKKAGVLNFSREALESVKEGKYSTGEGRKIEWNPTGEEFAVAFERGIIIYGSDSVPASRALPQPLTKIHQMRFVHIPSKDIPYTILAASTEDGRVIFYSSTASAPKTPVAMETTDHPTLPDATPLAQLGGKPSGTPGRIKDFEVLPLQSSNQILVVTAGSDGAVGVWAFPISDLISRSTSKQIKSKAAPGSLAPSTTTKQIGKIIGTYETGNRITCLKAFIMLPARTNEEEGFTEAEIDGEEEDDDEEAELSLDDE